jgi:glycosyltransferase involved in cell wall biosynthesis
MRILYDDSLAMNPAGTGTFVRGLLAGLRARSDVEIVAGRSRLDGAPNLDVRDKRLGGRLGRAWYHLRHYLHDLPDNAQRLECDAIYCPTSLGPLRGRVPSFITLFDLSPLTHAATIDQISGRYIRAMLRVGLNRSAGVSTISQAVAAEIRQRFPHLHGAVAVAYPGPNLDLIEAAAAAPEIPEAPFLLMVGTLEPRKNHLTIVRALADHVRRRPTSPLRLVLAGSPGWLYDPVLAAIEQLGLQSRVSRLGKVDAGVLKWLYQKAAALVFPSLYEGFGLPVVEAFALGCPVVAARIDSVVEIAQEDSAVLLEPTDVPAWASALDTIEARRLPPGMVDAARQRAQDFTWPRCAESVVTLIRSSLTRGGQRGTR